MKLLDLKALCPDLSGKSCLFGNVYVSFFKLQSFNIFDLIALHLDILAETSASVRFAHNQEAFSVVEPLLIQIPLTSDP